MTAGFEYQGVHYDWHVSDTGKDLRLIDHFAQMPVPEFFRAVEDEFDRERGPILLALMATSIRHKRPDWSVEKVARVVDDLSLGDVEWVDGDDADPPPIAGETPASPHDEPESSPSSPAEPENSPESTTSSESSGNQN